MNFLLGYSFLRFFLGSFNFPSVLGGWNLPQKIRDFHFPTQFFPPTGTPCCLGKSRKNQSSPTGNFSKILVPTNSFGWGGHYAPSTSGPVPSFSLVCPLLFIISVSSPLISHQLLLPPVLMFTSCPLSPGAPGVKSRCSRGWVYWLLGWGVVLMRSQPFRTIPSLSSLPYYVL